LLAVWGSEVLALLRRVVESTKGGWAGSVINAEDFKKRGKYVCEKKLRRRVRERTEECWGKEC
jgi:hypothetical protein